MDKEVKINDKSILNLKNSVTVTLKRCSILSLIFTCLCITKPLLTMDKHNANYVIPLGIPSPRPKLDILLYRLLCTWLNEGGGGGGGE